jgi:DNA-binding transcriptional MerR regulator
VRVEMHQIGQVAEAVGLSPRTIRHWEEIGPVLPSGRSAGGFRLSTDRDAERLRMETVRPAPGGGRR